MSKLNFAQESCSDDETNILCVPNQVITLDLIDYGALKWDDDIYEVECDEIIDECVFFVKRILSCLILNLKLVFIRNVMSDNETSHSDLLRLIHACLTGTVMFSSTYFI